MQSSLGYDKCTVVRELRDNASVLGHTMDLNRFLHVAPCVRDEVPGGNTSAVAGGQLLTPATPSAWVSVVDTETALRGTDRPLRRCADPSVAPGVATTPLSSCQQ